MAGMLGMALAGSVSIAAAQTQISGATPFPAPPAGPCDNELIDKDAVLFLNSEVEPWLDVNPADPNNLIAVWQQDRFSNGGARAKAGAYSTHGGGNWTTVTLRKLTKCTGGPWARATDPWVTFSPNGHAYAMSLVFDNFPPPNQRPAGEAPNAMVVQKSINKGADWSKPVTLIRDTSPRLFNDKNSMTADPNDSNYVYAVWDRLNSSLGVYINPENVFGLGYRGPALFTRTTNGGTSWEPAKSIYDPGGNNQTIGNQIVVLPQSKGGTVINFFNEILNFKNSDGGSQFDSNLAFVYSNNKGASWLPKGQPRRAQKIEAIGVVLPDAPSVPVRAGDILFDVAVDPINGKLYAVWQDARFSGFEIDQIAFSQSTDGGATWSAPIKVNLTPTNIRILRQQAFTPSVSVKSDGAVVINYYDFRNDTGTAGEELADYWAASCTPSPTVNCAAAASWAGSGLRLTSTSFNIRNAPFARGYFTGDYQGLAAVGPSTAAQSAAAFSIPQGADPGNIVFRKF